MKTPVKIIELLKQLAPNQGYNRSALEGVMIMHSNRVLPKMPVMYEPSIVVVFQGKKLGFLGEETFRYDPQHFLVLTVPLPFESETVGSKEEPMLAVSINIQLDVLADLMLTLGMDNQTNAAPQLGIMSTPLDQQLTSSVTRLIDALTSPTEVKILGPSILREIYYRVLTGPQGPAIRTALLNNNKYTKIGKALHRIHGAFSEPLNVDELASEAGMSVAGFHARFKIMTGNSPIQYIKQLRLHKAKYLLAHQGMMVATVSRQVGYESNSQFNREYKRMFGHTPGEESKLNGSNADF